MGDNFLINNLGPEHQTLRGLIAKITLLDYQQKAREELAFEISCAYGAIQPSLTWWISQRSYKLHGILCSQTPQQPWVREQLAHTMWIEEILVYNDYYNLPTDQIEQNRAESI